MGILNVTPDSFSSINVAQSTASAILEAQKLVEQGAHILDVGGESTRPGAVPLSSEQEWQRLAPVLQEVMAWNMPISIDTYHAETMRKALDSGVDIINDIWALRQPNAMHVVSKFNCGVCMMHMHGEPQTMQIHPMQGKALDQVMAFFKHQIDLTDASGIDRQRIVIDPGIGFGKTVEQNFELLANQDQLNTLQFPLMVGWSRKSSLGAVTGLGVHDRLVPSIAAALIAVERGARILRVHDVQATVAALAIWAASKQL